MFCGLSLENLQGVWLSWTVATWKTLESTGRLTQVCCPSSLSHFSLTFLLLSTFAAWWGFYFYRAHLLFPRARHWHCWGIRGMLLPICLTEGTPSALQPVDSSSLPPLEPLSIGTYLAMASLPLLNVSVSSLEVRMKGGGESHFCQEEAAALTLQLGFLAPT